MGLTTADPTLAWALRLLALAGLTSCSNLFGPELPDGTTVLRPLPAQYGTWWELTERCSGLQAELTEVEFRTISEGFPDRDAAGAYYRDGHRIVLVENFAQDGFLVRHEMLHALLARYNSSGHPRAFFEGRCGGIVSCGEGCEEDIGGPVPGVYSAPLLLQDDVSVAVSITPATVTSPPIESGCFTVVVTATNRTQQALVMDLTVPQFRWSVNGIGGGGGGGPTPPNDSILLEPGDPRHYAFDCPRRLDRLDPGDYLVAGRWGTTASEEVMLSVVP